VSLPVPERPDGLTPDFAAVPLPLDLADFHTYAVDWTAERADFLVDGARVRGCPRPPAYPMQMMLAVFDFPETARAGDAADDVEPALVVDHLRGYRR
jgi:Glycosyl hydrolases family 16